MQLGAVVGMLAKEENSELGLSPISHNKNGKPVTHAFSYC